MIPNMRTRIKICGVTRPHDAALAAELGADAIGIVLYKHAKRCVSLETAKEIARAIPPYVTPVALFVDDTADNIRRTVDALGIRHIQLQGSESPALVAELRDYTIIKAIRVNRDRLATDLANWKRDIERLSLTHLAALLFESDSKLHGGSGQENDWNAIVSARNAGALDNLPPLVAAGGLHPDNVANVVRLLRPYAVDVSSGIEEEFGKKSLDKIDAFIRAVRSAELE
jgi:phosphoribosylanthranilate isomerase